MSRRNGKTAGIAGMLASRFFDLARRSTRAVGDDCLSPTALFFISFYLRVCYNSHTPKSEKGHSMTVGRKPSTGMHTAACAKGILLHECYGDHTMECHPSNKFDERASSRSGGILLEFFQNVKLLAESDERRDRYMPVRHPPAVFTTIEPAS